MKSCMAPLLQSPGCSEELQSNPLGELFQTELCSHGSITSVWNYSQQLILKNAFLLLILSNLESRVLFAGIYFQVDMSHFSTEI